MFNEVELTYFRQHQSLTVTFENGVVALRGDNEKGKTTLLESIAYAMFGATALREPLADTVTWGQKESALKVRMVATINGVRYTTKRGKSGAEISNDTHILATGQTEVKKYWETLLGADATTCANLMLADQAGLRGVLKEGPGAAIALIEKLSNFALIETIVGLVQTKLPCGTTSNAEARVAMLEGQMAVPVEDDTEPLKIAVAEAELVADTAAHKQQAARSEYDIVQPAAQAAQAAVDAHKQAEVASSNAVTRWKSAEQVLATIVPVPGPSEARLKELRDQVADAGRLGRAKVAKAALAALPELENEWEGDHDSFNAAWSEVKLAVTAIAQSNHDIALNLTRLNTLLITEAACGLCGKDLAAVPEVVTKNAATQAQIDQQKALLLSGQASLADKAEESDAYAAIHTAMAGRQRVYQQHAEFLTLDHGYVPARATYTGPDTEVTVAGNPASELQQAEALAAAYQRDMGRKQQAERVVEETRTACEAAKVALDAAAVPVRAALTALETAAELTQCLYAADAALRDAQQAHQNAQQALKQAQAVLAERQRARDALQAQLAAAKKDLEDMQFNNDLLKRLRDARPDIANELWGIMSASISSYFSDIRGVPSTFTRENGGFKVDGHSVSGLSGSTLDSLGLAIRVAATKTFLPNANFMVLDEPAAACDDGREQSMLGVIASSDFGQVIVVSHSELLDSFAAQVVRL
jgi:DNA repair exonuclease SbcCD ATPase subunit